MPIQFFLRKTKKSETIIYRKVKNYVIYPCPTEIWTQIAGFRVQSANHYTMGLCTVCEIKFVIYRSKGKSGPACYFNRIYFEENCWGSEVCCGVRHEFVVFKKALKKWKYIPSNYFTLTAVIAVVRWCWGVSTFLLLCYYKGATLFSSKVSLWKKIETLSAGC